MVGTHVSNRLKCFSHRWRAIGQVPCKLIVGHDDYAGVDLCAIQALAKMGDVTIKHHASAGDLHLDAECGERHVGAGAEGDLLHPVNTSDLRLCPPACGIETRVDPFAYVGSPIGLAFLQNSDGDSTQNMKDFLIDPGQAASADDFCRCVVVGRVADDCQRPPPPHDRYLHVALSRQLRVAPR